MDLKINVSKGNKKFLEKYHPTKIKCNTTDLLGFQILSIITSHNSVPRKTKTSLDDYTEELIIDISTSLYLRRVKKMKDSAIVAINLHFSRLLKKEFLLFIRQTYVDLNYDVKMIDIIELFKKKHGLSEDDISFETLKRYEYRKRN